MQVPKTENTDIREQVIQNPLYAESISLQAIKFQNKAVYPNIIDENSRDQNRNDHNVPTSPV